MPFDRNYAIACTIIQAIEPDYPSPSVREFSDALRLASEISGELWTDEVIEWAKNYATEWFEKYMK